MSRSSISTVLVIAFLMRFTLLVANTFFITLPESGKDDKRFESLAWEWTTTGIVPTDAFAESGAGVFIKAGAALYFVVGHAPFLWAFIMVILGTVTVYNIYKSTYLLWNDKSQAIRAGWMAAIFPEFAMLSAVLLREVVIHFFLSFAVVALIKFWKYKHKVSIVYFVLFIGLCTVFHSAMIISLGGFGLAIFLISQEGKKKSSGYKIGALVLIIGGLIFINYTGIGLSKFGGSFDSAFSKFQSMESTEALGRAVYPDWLKMTNGITDIWKLPIRFIAFLFSPAIPFMVSTISHLAGVLDASFYVFIFYTIYKNRETIKENKTAYVIFIISMSLALVYSLGVSNFGTAIRHRAKLLPLFLVLAIDYKALKKNQLRKKRMLEKKKQTLQLEVK